MSKADDVRKFVSASYADAVRRAVARRKARTAGQGDAGKSGAADGGKPAVQRKSCCCSPDSTAASEQSLAEMAGYSRESLSGLPPDAVASSFGCGNPLALAAVREGDTVLDLGSGAGIDLLLAAKLAGPAGRAIGVDMTDEMIVRAKANAAAAGLSNVEVRKGIIEDLPLPDGSVDLVISNCVINLSPEKHRVFAELYRVLKPGGRISISDIVSEPLPDVVKSSVAMYAACIGGAIPEADYLDGLRAAGLVEVGVADRLVYDAGQLAGLLGAVDDGGCCCGGGAPAGDDASGLLAAVAGRIASVRFVGSKPAGKAL